MGYILDFKKWNTLNEQEASPVQIQNNITTQSFNLGLQWPVGKTGVNEVTRESRERATAALNNVAAWTRMFLPFNIVVKIDAYESMVTPTDPAKQDLWYAKQRRESAKQFIQQWLNGLDVPDKFKQTLRFEDGKTERRGDAYVQGQDNPNDPKYVDDQAIDLTMRLANDETPLFDNSIPCGGDAGVSQGKQANRETTGPAADAIVAKSGSGIPNTLGNKWLYMDGKSGTFNSLAGVVANLTGPLNYTRLLQVVDPNDSRIVNGKLTVQFDPKRIPDRLTFHCLQYKENELRLTRLHDTGFRGDSNLKADLFKLYKPGGPGLQVDDMINGPGGNYSFEIPVPTGIVGGVIFVCAYAPLESTIFDLNAVCTR